MDLELLKAFATTFGAIAGGGALIVIVPKAFAIGKKWGVVETTVTQTSIVASETRDAVRVLADTVNGRLGKLEFAVWGIDERNGMRSDVQEHEQRLDAIERVRR